MTIAPAVIERIEALRDDEIALREEGRQLELVPANRERAARLFSAASVVREERLAVLRSCQLI